MAKGPPFFAVSAKNVSFSYGETKAIKEISLDVMEGSFTAILGPNGSGKSTFLKLISGYLKPEKGSLTVLGNDIGKVTPEKRAGLLTLTGDEPHPAFAYSVEETVLMGRQSDPLLKRTKPEVSTVLKKVGLSDKKDRSLATLSAGERQRMYLARAMYQNPLIFLLDEPTAHLDMAYEMMVMGLLKDLVDSEGKTVLGVFHDLNLAVRYATRIVFMKDGALKYDAKSSCLTEEMVGSVYDIDVKFVGPKGVPNRLIVPYLG